MKNSEQIVKVESTAHEVIITLNSGVVLHVSSGRDVFGFSISNIEDHTRWGPFNSDEFTVERNNTNRCYYKQKEW